MKYYNFLYIVVISLSIISCGENDPEPVVCEEGIHYKLDGQLINFDNTQVTAEIFNDAAIGKFYDIWTDEQSGFYYHSTITESGETATYATNWFTTDDVANILFLNSKTNVNVNFTIDQGANTVNDQITISFSGSYEEGGTTHTISEGKICTTIDIVH